MSKRPGSSPRVRVARATALLLVAGWVAAASLAGLRPDEGHRRTNPGPGSVLPAAYGPDGGAGFRGCGTYMEPLLHALGALQGAVEGGAEERPYDALVNRAAIVYARTNVMALDEACAVDVATPATRALSVHLGAAAAWSACVAVADRCEERGFMTRLRGRWARAHAALVDAERALRRLARPTAMLRVHGLTFG